MDDMGGWMVKGAAGVGDLIGVCDLWYLDDDGLWEQRGHW